MSLLSSRFFALAIAFILIPLAYQNCGKSFQAENSINSLNPNPSFISNEDDLASLWPNESTSHGDYDFIASEVIEIDLNQDQIKEKVFLSAPSQSEVREPAAETSDFILRIVDHQFSEVHNQLDLVRGVSADLGLYFYDLDQDGLTEIFYLSRENDELISLEFSGQENFTYRWVASLPEVVDGKGKTFIKKSTENDSFILFDSMILSEDQNKSPQVSLINADEPTPNTAPEVTHQTYRLQQGLEVNGQFPAVDSEGDLLKIEILKDIQTGQFHITPESLDFRFVPENSQVGSYSLDYRAIDSKGLASQPATLTFIIEKSISTAIDGNWSNWAPWGACNKTCDRGLQTRTRSCTNPIPANGGQACAGASSEERPCNTQACPIDGNWGTFGSWSACTKDCGGGTQSRSRSCNSPPPAFGGKNCSGSGVESRSCNSHLCPVTPSPDLNGGGTVEYDHPDKIEENKAINALVSTTQFTHKAIKNGYWSDPSVWNTGKIPGTGAKVLIETGLYVIYDVVKTSRIKSIRVNGRLDFSTNKNTQLVIDTLISDTGSHFEIGSLTKPVESNVSTEIIIADNGPVSPASDPKQLGRGLVLQGKVNIHGMKKQAYLAIDLQARNGRKLLALGSSSFRVKGDLKNWQVGDDIVIMGTQKDQYQDEKRKIKAIQGRILTLDSPLAFNHNTPSFQTNNASGIGELNIYVGNLTRNIKIHSEYKLYDQVKRRGHVMIMHADGADIRYAQFENLGRTDKRIPINDARHVGTTNPEGRYPLYINGTGTQTGRKPFAVIGNAVTGSPGWGIAQRSSYGAINENFVYNILGAGIVSEDGNETGEWIGNFVTHIQGAPDRKKLNSLTVQNTGHIGFYGVAFESQSRLITQQRNIAANAKMGWSFMGITAARGYNRLLGEASPEQPYRLNPSEITVRQPDVTQIQFNHRPIHEFGNMTPQIVNFENNQAIALNTGVSSWSRIIPRPFELQNSIHKFISWRTKTPLYFPHFVGGYHISKSLFVEVDKVFITAEKTSKNHLIENHIEKADSSFHSPQLALNSMGIFYGNTEVDVSQPLKSLKIPNIPGGKVLTGLDKNKLAYFKKPIAEIIPLTSLQKQDHPILNLTSKKEFGPNTVFQIEGSILDSAGSRTFGESQWLYNLGALGADQSFNTADDKIPLLQLELKAKPGLVRSPFPGGFFGTDQYNSISWKEILKLYGTYKKNGQWILPIPIWINDALTGEHYPYLVDFKIVGANDNDLKKYELSTYPTIDLNGTHYGNPNVNEDGSFKPTRSYYRKSWRVPIPQ